MGFYLFKFLVMELDYIFDLSEEDTPDLRTLTQDDLIWGEVEVLNKKTGSLHVQGYVKERHVSKIKFTIMYGKLDEDSEEEYATVLIRFKGFWSLKHSPKFKTLEEARTFCINYFKNILHFINY